MILQRYSNLRILYNDIMRTLKIKYARDIQGIIPLFISDSNGIKAIHVIRTSSDELIIVMNENLYNAYMRNKSINTEDNTMDICVIYSVVAEVLSNVEEADKYMAGWLGFNNVINLIKTGELGDNIRYRIKMLENSLLNNKLYNNLPRMSEFLNNISFVGVESQ